MRALGILGGMFDPLHAGHLNAARAALAAGLDTVLLAPCGSPAHRGAPLAPARHRLRMCQLAAEAHPGLEASDIELRSDVCYAVDTVRLLRRQYPGARVSWLMGADKLPTLAQWHEAEALFTLCDFLVCPRPGHDASYSVPGATVRVLDCAPDDVSSGQVLSQLRGLSDAEGMLPRPVARHIAQNGLYQPDYTSFLLARGMREKRLAHTLRVRKEAVRLADIHGACMQKAGLAAMLHDAAKPLPPDEMRALAARYGLDAPDEVLASGDLLHGPLAAQMAMRELGVTDADVLQAIACHTTGCRDMSALALCLYVADSIEPGRKEFPGLSDIRRLADTDLIAAALLSMRRTRAYVLERGLPLYAATQEAIDSLTR